MPGLPAVLLREGLAINPVALPPIVFYPGLRPYIQDESLAQAKADVDAKSTVLAQSQRQLADARKRLDTMLARGGPGSAPATKPEALLADDFASAQTDRWQVGAGAWRYEKGASSSHRSVTRSAASSHWWITHAMSRPSSSSRSTAAISGSRSV